MSLRQVRFSRSWVFRSRAEDHRSRAPSAEIPLILAIGPAEIMSTVQSPLFEPVLWHDGGFKILDEIQVPQKIDYIEVTEVGQALDAVREMKTRAFGQVLTFLYSAALVAQHYHGAEAAPLRGQLQRLTQQFCDARPTFDFRGLGKFVEVFFDKIPAGADVGAVIARQAFEF